MRFCGLISDADGIPKGSFRDPDGDLKGCY